MAAPHSFFIVGWTLVGAVVAVSIVLLGLYLQRRKTAKARKDQGDLEQQNKNKTANMAMQNLAQQQQRPTSILDPFTQGVKKVTSVPRPFSMLRNPEAGVSKPEEVAKATSVLAEEPSAEAPQSPLPSPLSQRARTIRDSLDLSSLVSATPFSESFPQGWGKPVPST